MNSDTTIGVLSGISYSLGADGTGTGGFAALSNEDLIAGAMELEAHVSRAHADALHGHAE